VGAIRFVSTTFLRNFSPTLLRFSFSLGRLRFHRRVLGSPSIPSIISRYLAIKRKIERPNAETRDREIELDLLSMEKGEKPREKRRGG